MRSIAYYVSGHGFGHARRSAEVLRALLEMRPDVVAHVRTTAPRWLFDELPRERWTHGPVELDPGAVEDDALSINLPATLERVKQALSGKTELVQREAAYLRGYRVELIAADVPFVAGDVAEAVGIPAVAVSNFTWDWIYEPWFGDEPEVIASIRESYGKFHSIVHLPWGGFSSAFRNVIESPLVVTSPRFEREQVRRRLGLDGRAAILVAMRGGASDEALLAAARQSPEFVFLCLKRLPAAPSNIVNVELSTELRFIDLLPACDAALCKLGYGIIADCIRCRLPLLYPPRTAFREDPLAAERAAEYINLRPLGLAAYHAGNWRDGIEAILSAPRPTAVAAVDGAEVCARALASHL